MADPLSTDEGEQSSGTKPNFIGKVVKSEMESEDYPMKDEYKDEGETYYEMLWEVKPLDKDWKNQRTFSIKVNSNFQSKWMLVVGHLQAIHGNLREAGIESAKDLEEFLTGRVYEFREVDFTEDEEFTFPGTDTTVVFNQMFRGGGNDPNPLLLPVREVTDEDELMDLSAGEPDDDTEVEEVEI